MLFVGFKKAFDITERGFLWQCMKEFGIPIKLTHLRLLTSLIHGRYQGQIAPP